MTESINNRKELVQLIKDNYDRIDSNTQESGYSTDGLLNYDELIQFFQIDPEKNAESDSLIISPDGFTKKEIKTDMVQDFLNDFKKYTEHRNIEGIDYDGLHEFRVNDSLIRRGGNLIANGTTCTLTSVALALWQVARLGDFNEDWKWYRQQTQEHMQTGIVNSWEDFWSGGERFEPSRPR